MYLVALVLAVSGSAAAAPSRSDCIVVPRQLDPRRFDLADEEVAYAIAVPHFAGERSGSERGLEEKYATGWYRKAPWVRQLDMGPWARDIDRYLRNVVEDQAPGALLAYWWGRGRGSARVLCAGLMLEGKRMLLEAVAVGDWSPEDVTRALDLERRQAPRAAHRRGARAVAATRRGRIDVAATLARASRMLLPGRIGNAIPGIASLLILPVGALGTVPFAALPMEDRKPLVEHVAIAIAPTLDVVRRPRPTASTGRAIVVGDPDLAGDSTWEFPPLPGARREATAVAALLGATALVGKDATHDAVRAALAATPLPAVVYFATHGVTDPANPQDGSFLALSGAHLYTRELKDVKLGGALVVLSACQTGLGKVFDAGVFGMALNWWFAGAGAVVSSLWSVDDAATEELLLAFMRRRGHAMPPAQALAEAMREVRVSRPDPALWSGFAVFGGLTLDERRWSHDGSGR